MREKMRRASKREEVESDLKRVGELKFYHWEKIRRVIEDWNEEEKEISKQLTQEICEPDIY